jgi:hypothetical protein
MENKKIIEKSVWYDNNRDNYNVVKEQPHNPEVPLTAE